MPTRASITFGDSASTDRPSTKFGGQPDWIGEAQWPISRSLGRQMRFICQIQLVDELFSGGAGKFAYIFMTEDDEYVDGTWEPDGGENAVIVQPAGSVDEPIVEVRPLASGPTMQKYVKSLWRKRPKPIDVEFPVHLAFELDPDFIAEADTSDLPKEEREAYWSALEGNKIGGTPGFMQGDEFPTEEDDWCLLLQLDSCSVPFSINFGDAGIAYAFVNRRLSRGRFLWQCA